MIEYLTESEVKEILQARLHGFAGFYPAYPDAESQAINTLRGARAFTRSAPPDCRLCGTGEAHQHEVVSESV